jgi:hypothetical protein
MKPPSARPTALSLASSKCIHELAELYKSSEPELAGFGKPRELTIARVVGDRSKVMRAVVKEVTEG